MPQTIYLLRHAETTQPTVFHGCESDVDLSERGHEQARTIAAYLATLSPDAIVCSAMRRAILTAEPIAHACNLELQVEPLLHERCVGELSGMAYGHKGIWEETQRRWVAGDVSYAPAGSESWDDLRDRLLPVWERITGEATSKKRIIVTHGICCKLLLLETMPGRSIANWYELGPIYNVAIHELARSSGHWQLERMNFLPAELPPPHWASDHGHGK